MSALIMLTRTLVLFVYSVLAHAAAAIRSLSTSSTTFTICASLNTSRPQCR